MAPASRASRSSKRGSPVCSHSQRRTFAQGLATVARHLQQPFTTRQDQEGIPPELHRRAALPFEQLMRSPAEIVERLGSTALQVFCRSDDLPDAIKTEAVLGRDVLCRLAAPAGAHDPRVPRLARDGATVADMRPHPCQRM